MNRILYWLKAILKLKEKEDLKADSEAYITRIEENTERLWSMLENVLECYSNKACQCAYPRFRQLVSIDCSETGDSYYVSETEGLLHHAKPYFNVKPIDRGSENVRELWTCKKCGSEYEFGWSDFSIRVDRSYLRVKTLKVAELGRAITEPIPLYVGAFGHSTPRARFKRVGIKQLKLYLLEE
jgi:hypothetical protein